MAVFAFAATGKFPLHHVENLRLDDGFMVARHIILGDFPFVYFLFLGEKIRGVGFLEQGIAFVFFVGQHPLDRAEIPFRFFAGGRNTISG